MIIVVVIAHLQIAESKVQVYWVNSFHIFGDCHKICMLILLQYGTLPPVYQYGCFISLG